MQHQLAAALLSVLCCTWSVPAVAHGDGDDRASFADLLRESVDDRLSFETTQGSWDAAWQHAPVALDNLFDLREHWGRFDRQSPDVDEWRAAFSRWNKRWQEPDNLRSWHGWGRDWQYPPHTPAVPEPSGIAMLVAGIAVLVAVRGSVRSGALIACGFLSRRPFNVPGRPRCAVPRSRCAEPRRGSRA